MTQYVLQRVLLISGNPSLFVCCRDWFILSLRPFVRSSLFHASMIHDASFILSIHCVYKGGILLISIISFQTILPLQSALVVGKSLILLILYKPTPNQIKLSAMKISLGVESSTFPDASSNFRNCELSPKTLLRGVRMDIPVMEMDHMLRLDPDMYIMKEFMRRDLPGVVARAMAMDCFLRMMARVRCFSAGASSVEWCDEEDLELLESCLSWAATRRIPRGQGNF
mmetsp:Transcript_6868/g.10079  ORF Transcript_6868/g.10079 Transcript_6868/m.10079 type:complete len:226 (-) Transcript_6868:27-704(-)